MSFSLDEIDRCERQILLPEWGAAGQERVRASSVTLAGRGVAAEMAARYLAGAGVGRLAVCNPAHAEIARAINPNVDILIDTNIDVTAGEAARAILDEEIQARVTTDTRAAGCALALETLKAILGLPHHADAGAVLATEAA